MLAGEPLAVNDQFAVSEDTPLQIAAPGVLLNDLGSGLLSATVAVAPQHGELKLLADGSFHYQPDDDFYGEDSFTYQASDGKASTTPATVKITVLPVADGNAIPTPDVYFARQDTPLLATGLGTMLAETGFNDTAGIGAAAGDNAPYAIGAAIAGQGGGEPGWIGPWVQNDGAVAKVSHDALEGDGSLMLLPTGLTARQWKVPDPNAPFTFEMRMKFTPSAYISLYLFDGENTLTQFSADAVGGPQLNIDEFGNVGVMDGGDSEPSGFKIEPGKWHTFVFEVDPASHSYRFFFDHVEAPGPDPFNFRGGPAKIDAIAFIPQVSGDGILVDGLQIYSGHQRPGVAANEVNVDSLPLLVQLEAAPAHAAAFKLNADGTFEYTPATGFIGQDTFTYRFHDGVKVSDPVLVTILVEDVLHAPQAESDAFALDEGSILTVSDPLLGLLANDSDADGDPLVVQFGEGPTHGQLKLSDDGTFVYTPAADFVGVDHFTYRAFDGKFASAATTVSLTVAKLDRSPLAVDDFYTVDEDGVLEAHGSASEPALYADFSGNSLPDWLEGTGFQVAGGVIRREGSPSPFDRSYIRTKDGGYLTRDFIAEVSYTTSPTQDPSILFFGLGAGAFSPGGVYQEPVESVFLRLHTPTTSDGHVGISNAPASDTAVLGHVTEAGLHRARFEKLGQTLKVSVDANYNGHFDADLTYTIDNLASYAPFLNDTNAHLFFGTALPNDSFDDFTIYVPTAGSVLANDKVPEPGPAPAVDLSVPGPTNLWLAGMPDGSTASVSDAAPAQSPKQVTGLAIVPGQALRFTATGGVSNGVAESSSPDGQNTFVEHGSGAENGIANILAPLNSLIGVFLDDESPAGKPAPQALDFRPTSSNVPNGLNYGEISPGLRQPFFIGNGLGPDGTPQQVKVPAGATRLFLAAMDSNSSFNNSGDFAVKVASPIAVPSAAVLVTGPAHGQLAFNADGSFHYTPAPDYFGSDSFQYKITSRYGESAPATVSLVVQPVFDPPHAHDDAYLVRQNTSLATSSNPLILNDDLFTQFPLAGVADSRWTMRQSTSLERDGDYAPLPELTDDSSEPTGWSPDPGQVFYRDPQRYVWVGANTTGQELVLANNHWPAGTVALHPPGTGLVVVTWTAPTAGLAELEFAFTDANVAGLTGQNWYVEKNDSSATLAQGLLTEGGDTGLLRRTVLVAAGDRINFVVDANGNFNSDTLLLHAQVRLQVDATGVLANDWGDEAATLSAVLGVAPAHGHVVLHADGRFNYTPVAGYLGVDEFTYYVTDGVNQSAPATVLLFVEPKLLEGDIDGNRQVDLSDFGLLKNFFGLAPAFPAQGDLNGDHKVDLSDFGVLKENFGRQGPLAAALSATRLVAAAADTTSPTATITPVTPDPHFAPVDSLEIVFSEPVAGFDLSDLVLARNGGSNLLTPAQTLSTADNTTYVLSNLSAITAPAGLYTLTLPGAFSGIFDTAGNAYTSFAEEHWIQGIPEIQAENFARRTAAAGHQWSIVDQETTGAGTFTGASGDYLQLLTTSGLDSTYGSVAGPAAPSVEFDVSVQAAGLYAIQLRVAGTNSASDSLWVEIVGVSPYDKRGNAQSGAAVRIDTSVDGVFQPRDAGVWSLAAGTQTIRLSMRESGVAVDSLQLVPIVPTFISGPTEIQAEDFQTSTAFDGFRWWVVDRDTPPVYRYRDATGPSADFVQALDATGDDPRTDPTAAPTDAAVGYPVVVGEAGQYLLRVRSAGRFGTNSLAPVWLYVPTGLLQDGLGNPTVLTPELGRAVEVTARLGFDWRDAGVWQLESGLHTLYLSMSVSGAAVDAFEFVPLDDAIPIEGVTEIQAENYSARRDQLGLGWRAVDLENPALGAFSGATGNEQDFLQAIPVSEPASPGALVEPTAGYVDYNIQVTVAGTYELAVRAAGLSPTQDSLWVEVLGAGAPKVVSTNNSGAFALLRAGDWALSPGKYTIRVYVRETYTAIDALYVTPPAAPVPIDGATEIQAESFVRRQASGDHQWNVVNKETPGVGTFSGATGVLFKDYLQALGSNADSSRTNIAPSAPWVEYEIQVTTPGLYELSAWAAGVSATSDSLWVQVPTGSLSSAQGLTLVGGGLQINTNQSHTFEKRPAGLWSLTAGVHTIRVSMRESGAAIDRLEIAFVPTITGLTVIDGVDFTRRQANANHQWWKVGQEISPLGLLAGYDPTEFSQVLTTQGQDSGAANLTPAAPWIEFDVLAPSAGVYEIKLNVGSFGGTSDSVWLDVQTGFLHDAQRNQTVEGALLIAASPYGGFISRPAGQWNLPAGLNTIRISMRESGAMVGSVQISPISVSPAGVITVQAENLDSLQTSSGHHWWTFDQKTPGFGTLTGQTGPTFGYVQSLTKDKLDSSFGNLAAPATPTIGFNVTIPASGPHDLKLRIAGLNPASDSLWVEVPTGTLLDAQGNVASGAALQINADSSGVFTFRDAGRWNLSAGVHQIRVSMRESGTAIDALQIIPFTHVSSTGVTEISAEAVSLRQAGYGHQWSIIGQDATGAGVFAGESAPPLAYLQALTSGGQDSPYGSVAAPAKPTAEFGLVVAASGAFDLKVRVAGLNAASDSLWVEVPAGTLVNAQGNAVSGAALRIETDTTGVFTLKNAGRWTLSAGTHTIRISMRESGAALDSLQLVPVSAAQAAVVDAPAGAAVAAATNGIAADTTGPTMTILPVSPDPHGGPVDAIQIVFSEPISGFELSDLILDLQGDGLGTLLTATQTLLTPNAVHWTLGGLSSITGALGRYSLGLRLSGANIVDLAGNPLQNSPAESWLNNGGDTTSPSVSFVEVSPDPRSTPVDEIVIVFSEPVTGFQLSDLNLDRASDGAGNLLTGAQTLTTLDNITWRLGNLGPVTTFGGQYSLTFFGNHGITDLGANPLIATTAEVWSKAIVDSVPPTVDIVDIAPDPRGNPVSQVTIVFSEPVTGFDLGDLNLDRSFDGLGNLLTGAQTLTTEDNITWVLGNLSGVTANSGQYALSVLTTGGIRDAGGNLLAATASDIWTKSDGDLTPPTVVDIVDVSPDPRATGVNQISIVFSEAVTGFDVGDLNLDRAYDGLGNLLTGAQTLTTSDNITWTLGNLAGLNAAEGLYVLSFKGGSLGVIDAAGNVLAGSLPSEQWRVTADLTPPTGDIVNVSPDPRTMPVDSLTIVFSKAVAGFQKSDLILDRASDGLGSLIGAAQTLTTTDNITWTLGNLGPITGLDGDYTVYLRSDSGITDLFGNPLSGSVVEQWRKNANDAIAPVGDEFAAVDAALLDWDA